MTIEHSSITVTIDGVKYLREYMNHLDDRGQPRTPNWKNNVIWKRFRGTNGEVLANIIPSKARELEAYFQEQLKKD